MPKYRLPLPPVLVFWNGDGQYGCLFPQDHRSRNSYSMEQTAGTSKGKDPWEVKTDRCALQGQTLLNKLINKQTHDSRVWE